MERATKEIQGFGVLSERSAEDVLTLTEYAKRNENTPMINLIVCATVIAHSLKPHCDSLKKQAENITLLQCLSMWRNFKTKRLMKLEIKQLLDPQHLLFRFSQAQLYELYTEVLLLEGVDIKKKVTEAESKSADALPTV